MKPFNLEAALAGAKVVTRDGDEVLEIVHFNTQGLGWPIRAVIHRTPSTPCVYQFEADGAAAGGRETALDLFMAPTVKKYWVNVYKNDTYLFTGKPQMSEHEAGNGRKAGGNFIKTISFEIEE